jgi:threonylcarbamoyladenosine tRNA methylthiotransferase MtaB
MNKKDTCSLYIEIVKKAKKINPLMAISCDIMVGFPHEDEESFQNTVQFLREIRPMRMHIFTFSPRENTPFWRMKIRSQDVIRRRYNFLKRLSEEFSWEYKKKFLGKVLYMVAEERRGSFTCGYTENYIRVYLNEKVPLGRIYPVRVKRIEEDRVYVIIID